MTTNSLWIEPVRVSSLRYCHKCGKIIFMGDDAYIAKNGGNSRHFYCSECYQKFIKEIK